VTFDDNRPLFRISILFATSFTSFFLQSSFLLSFYPSFLPSGHSAFSVCFIFSLILSSVFCLTFFPFSSLHASFAETRSQSVRCLLMNYDSTGCLCPVIYLRTSVYLILLFTPFDSVLRLILFRLIHWLVYYTFNDAYSTYEVVPYPVIFDTIWGVSL